MTADTVAPPVSLEITDGVAAITFRQPQYRNALGLEALQATLDALLRAETRDDVGAVLLTGEGDAFCSGFNLKEIPLAGRDPERVVQHFQTLAMWWHLVLHRVVRIGKPVLAAVNGVAAGGGLGLAAAADLAVGADSARFLCAWHAIGIANDTATSYTLAKIVGYRRAMELMLTNRTLSAAEALEWGLVNRVYPAAELPARAREIAADLAAGPTHLQAMAKERFHAGWRQPIEECTEHEVRNVLTSVADSHFRRELEAFLRKERRSDAVQVRLP